MLPASSQFATAQRAYDATGLALRMRKEADSAKLPYNHPLRLASQSWDHYIQAFYSVPQRITLQGFLREQDKAKQALADFQTITQAR